LRRDGGTGGGEISGPRGAAREERRQMARLDPRLAARENDTLERTASNFNGKGKRFRGDKKDETGVLGGGVQK